MQKEIVRMINDIVTEYKIKWQTWILFEFRNDNLDYSSAIVFDTRQNYVKVYYIKKYKPYHIDVSIGDQNILKIADHDSCWRDWVSELNRHTNQLEFHQIEFDNIEIKHILDICKETYFNK